MPSLSSQRQDIDQCHNHVFVHLFIRPASLHMYVHSSVVPNQAYIQPFITMCIHMFAR